MIYLELDHTFRVEMVRGALAAGTKCSGNMNAASESSKNNLPDPT